MRWLTSRRCTALPESLDDGGDRQTTNFVNVLVQHLSSTELWDNYGVDDDIIVSFSFHRIIILADERTMKPFTNDFPRADIYEMLAPDLLHQVIKGSFKDHLVEWIGEYLKTVYGESRGNSIMDDIDRRIAATPPFTGLRRFPHGRRFKQWTGDDSKALMKVNFLVCCLHQFLRKCLGIYPRNCGVCASTSCALPCIIPRLLLLGAAIRN